MLPKLEVPTYECKLVSTNENVIFRPFLVKEYKVLMTVQNADSLEITRIIKDLVDVCTFNKLKVNELPYFDVEYLFLQIRSKSIGENVDVNITCKNCDHKNKTSYNIDNLKIETSENHTKTIDLGMGYGLVMKYPSIDEAIDIFEKDTQDLVDNLIVSNIVTIFNETEVWDTKDLEREQVLDFVGNLQKSQYEKIEEFFTTSPQITQVIETKCTNCESEIVVKLKGLYNFFV